MEHTSSVQRLTQERERDTQDTVHEVQYEESDREQLSTGPTWRRGEPAPDTMTSSYGSAVVHGNTAYFSENYNVYSYTLYENTWTTLPRCKYQWFTLAVIKCILTSIGGEGDDYNNTNILLSLNGSTWKEDFPPMKTIRKLPAAASTPTHLVVAGGRTSLYRGYLVTVEVLNTDTLQWSTASSLPAALRDNQYSQSQQMTLCGGCFYLTDIYNILLSCSVEELLESCEPPSTNSSDGGSVWTRLADTPMYYSSLATLRRRVLAIGGAADRNGDNPTGAIHCYDVATNSWSRSAIGEMTTPRSRVLPAVLPTNELVVVGGRTSTYSDKVEIANLELLEQ